MHLEIICRICLNEGILKPLFTTECLVNKRKILCIEMLKFCSDKPVDITDDSPKQICGKCLSRLTTSYKFKQLWEASYMKINSFLASLIKEKKNANDKFTSEEVSDAGCDEAFDFDKLSEKSINKNETILNENNSNNVFLNGIEVNNGKEFKKMKIKKKVKKLKEGKIKHLYFCELCQKSFRNEELHKKRIHSERSPSQCERCAAVFLKPYSLSLHMRQHDNNLPYPCTHPGCEKAFAIPSMLKQHAMSHTDERPFVCQYCSHAARTKQQLVIHIRYHHTKEKNYKCSFCEKAFVSYQARYNHEKRHKNIRDYQCQFCEKSFVSAGNLVNHMLTHTGEKKFECRLCGTRFGRKAHKDKHETNVHGIAPTQNVSLSSVMRRK